MLIFIVYIPIKASDLDVNENQVTNFSTSSFDVGANKLIPSFAQ